MMTADCSHITSNISYNCSTPWGSDCQSKGGFSFANLWNYTQTIQQSCDSDPRLFGIATSQNAALTQPACTKIVGSSWAYYPGDQIWQRLTTWKFPLLQLVSAFPRPPLSFWVEMFVINHLLGDPLDTLRNLFSKLSSCQKTAEYWQAQSARRKENKDPKSDQNWKILAIIEETYDEWGVGGDVRQVL